MNATDGELAGLDVQVSGPPDSKHNLQIVVTLDERIQQSAPEGLDSYPLRRRCPQCGSTSVNKIYRDDRVEGLDVKVLGPTDGSGMLTVKVSLKRKNLIPGTYYLARPCPLCGIGGPPKTD